jgi:hypothetical protein
MAKQVISVKFVNYHQIAVVLNETDEVLMYYDALNDKFRFKGEELEEGNILYLIN